MRFEIEKFLFLQLRITEPPTVHINTADNFMQALLKHNLEKFYRE